MGIFASAIFSITPGQHQPIQIGDYQASPVKQFVESITNPTPPPDWDSIVEEQLQRREQQLAEEAKQKAEAERLAALEAHRIAQEAVATPSEVRVSQPLYSEGAVGLLAAIRRCESGGNYRATNGSHFGAYQFDLSTWASVGGSGNPMDAAPAEQDMRAQTLMDQRGTQPWLASKSCWGR